MSRLLFAVARGVLWSYAGWVVSTNGARWAGRELGSKRLISGKARRWLNGKRRDVHVLLAGLFLVLCVVDSVYIEYTAATLSLTRLVPPLVLLFTIEFLLGGGHRKPVWNPWQLIREPGTTVGLAVETVTGLAGFTEAGSVFDRKAKKTRQRTSSSRAMPVVGTCPQCNARMVRRHNRSTGQAFLGCSNFPSCKGTRQS